MRDKSKQVARIVERLLELTESDDLRWRPVAQNVFDVRLGDYSISISESGARGGPFSSLTLSIKKMDGKEVAVVAAGRNALITGALGGIMVDESVIQKVRRIYEIISDSESDLEKILKLLS